MPKLMFDSKEAMQEVAEQNVERFEKAQGPFVVAVQRTRMAMLFTNATVPGHPIIFVNDSFCGLTGYDRQEILARNVDFFFAKVEDARVQKRIEAAIRETDTFEIECLCKDGSILRAEVYVSPVCDEDAKVVQHFWSFVDLTVHYERKSALERELSLQRELIHVSRLSAMGTMAATLAHEVNQPLTAISNYAAASRLQLTAGDLDVGSIEAAFTAIENCAQRAGRIISGLREMTRGGMSKREFFDLNDAVRESVELVRAGSCKGVHIESETDGVMMIEADRVQIQQVVINLAKNGCEAAAEVPNGRVLLTTDVEGDQAIVTVDDTGLGIAASAPSNLFEWSDSAKPGGMGLGLSISHTIVEGHEGKIWHESREGGTRFRFSVPVACA